MNENLNLAEILKDCPRGTKLYSTIFGEVELDKVESRATYPIVIRKTDVDGREILTSEGKLFMDYAGECILFPSRDQRDWSKFKVKQSKFNPNTLKPFDKVLFRDFKSREWTCGIFSHISGSLPGFPFRIGSYNFKRCIPYNDKTKHLVGTNEEAPEFYRYWED